jgi:glycosyltransferase involved in cell wall biosynthesis
MTPSIRKFGRFFLVSVNDEKEVLDFFSSGASNVKEIKNLSSFLKTLSSKYLLLINDEEKINCSKLSLRRLLMISEKKHAGIIYPDFMRREGNHLIKHPLIDYQSGSIRDDFNFGHLLLFSCEAIKSALQKYGSLPAEVNAALYDLRLKISTDHELIHVPEFLYSVSAKKQKIKKTRKQTEAQFAYVAKENFIRQKKLEKVATNHLKRIGAHMPPRTKKTNKDQDDLQWKASIVIPVLNRNKTIAEALTSALGQKTDFPFNIIVVDNHSTDGTTDILKKFTAKHPHLHHILPQRRDLGIGGCWNEAIYSPHCGRYVVQLDSDDLYRSPQTLQKIVNTLRRGQYAMVVGSYSLVNERLKPIPPGLIDHKEWTQKNGHNNLLRVNGMGAPRAFDSSVIRRFGFPNVSYGEDYAAALRITREYKIGRIYESLYLCRRWKNNTDAGLSVEKQNANNLYKDKLRTEEIEARKLINEKEPSWDSGRIFAEFPAVFSGGKDLSLSALCLSLYESQKKTWPKLFEACRDLASVRTRKLPGVYNVYLQYNPARAVSSGAAVDAESIKNRPCFLCENNLPARQLGVLYRSQYLILCNPAPIFEKHFTVVSLQHEPQEIAPSINRLLQLSFDLSPDYAVFYNGPCCGASAPDHLHFQAVPKNDLPFLREFKKLSPVRDKSSVKYSRGTTSGRSVIVLESKDVKELEEQFLHLLKTAQRILGTNVEPQVNVICDYAGNRWRLVVFLRRKHRPDAYFAAGENRIFISPGAVDMAGVIITPLLRNYGHMDYNAVRDIYREVSLSAGMMDTIIKEL